jgi:hypothetical protein
MAVASVAHAASHACTSCTSDDFTALVAELITDEHLTELEAQSQAVALLNDLDAYAAVWDSWAWSLGNTAAYPFSNDYSGGHNH